MLRGRAESSKPSRYRGGRLARVALSTSDGRVKDLRESAYFFFVGGTRPVGRGDVAARFLSALSLDFFSARSRIFEGPARPLRGRFLQNQLLCSSRPPLGWRLRRGAARRRAAAEKSAGLAHVRPLPIETRQEILLIGCIALRAAPAPPRPRPAFSLAGQPNWTATMLAFNGFTLIGRASRDISRFPGALREPFSQQWCGRASALKIKLGTGAQCPRTRRNARAAWLPQDARIASTSRRRRRRRRR